MKKAVLFIVGFLVMVYAGLSIYALWPVEEVPAKQFASTEDNFVTIGNTTMRYRVSGKKGDPVVLLVHGFAGSIYTYRKIIPLLEEDYQVFAIDMPGFGLSDKPDDYDYSYKNQGETISRFIEHFDLEDITLAGHSMGGNVVVNTALVNENVDHIILLDPGIIDDGNPEFLKYLFFPLTRISAKMFRDRDFRFSSFKNSYYHPEDISEEDLDAYMIASQTENFVNAMVTMLVNYDEPAEMDIVPLVDQPVLLLWGEHDRGNPPENGRVLLEAFKRAELFIIGNSGHYIHEEQPEETVSLMRAFIEIHSPMEGN